ncbi:MAG TPA: FAD-binding oxidoreductase [Candidatus Dormibacteraeota bacterium]|nr:FAD-binding oxidoreductase [Candidatus Dormibacteraeota bacterium]
MAKPSPRHPWGVPPWKIDFHPPEMPLPEAVDVAIVGAGFSGLSAAAWLRLLSPQTSVAIFESSHIGSGASGRTGGLVLAETAAGNLPGLGDVLAGLSDILGRLQIECDLLLPGAWEVLRDERKVFDKPSGKPVNHSPIHWSDSGDLHAVSEVPGGSLDPGKMVSGLAHAAHHLGTHIFENHPVGTIDWSSEPQLHVPAGNVRSKKVLLATSALSLDLSGLAQRAQPRLTLAASTAPLTEQQVAEIGLIERKPLYTIDLPYLWARICTDNAIVWGAGLVSPPSSGDLMKIDIDAPEPSRMFASLERRVHGLHPALGSAQFTHHWGGPISFRESWRPTFSRHPKSPNAIVLGTYAGHGVALSVYLGAWAAEALLGRRDLPNWGVL